MYLTKHKTAEGSRWALDDRALPHDFELGRLLGLPRHAIHVFLTETGGNERPSGPLLAPLDDSTEVWAAGVTYLRSREAREAESTVRDLYAKVYDAERPELFFKSPGWRVAGHGLPIRVRRDSRWNVPEPELTLAINAQGEIVGFSVGNDVSSRDIEGENPLYLPQAKIYDGSCAIGPGISFCDADALLNLSIELTVMRDGRAVFTGETHTSRIKRPLHDLVDYLRKELAFPRGALLMTGTGIVPPDEFSLAPRDLVRISIGDLTLENAVAP